MALSTPTKDHGQIRSWAAANDAVPAELSSADPDSGAMTLRFLFLDGSPNPFSVRPIAWTEFFIVFDQQELSIAYAEDDSELAKTYEFSREGTAPLRLVGNPA